MTSPGSGRRLRTRWSAFMARPITPAHWLWLARRILPSSPIHSKVRVTPYKYDGAFFEDWQSGTHNALIHLMGGNETTMAYRIFNWNVDTDQVSTIIPGGLHARYSPDGQSLLFTTIEPSSIYTTTISGPWYWIRFLKKVPFIFN